jgi:4-nitrophenyl phosphatase
VRFYPVVGFDLDGTLYRGNEVISGAPEAVQGLVNLGCKVFYITNNSSQTVASYVAKLTRMGFPADASQIVSSATATALYCRHERIRKAYVVGEPGLAETLTEAGVTVLNFSNGKVEASEFVEKADAVVVGISKTTLSYPLLDGALQQLRSGARFVATNTDKTFPLEGGRLSPGAGTMVAALVACSDQEPEVVGKPNPFILTSYLNEHGYVSEDVLVVGDRLDTDIACGVAANCRVALVLTGVVTERDGHDIDTFESVVELIENMISTRI